MSFPFPGSTVFAPWAVMYVPAMATPRITSLLACALALPREERAKLATELLASLVEEDNPKAEAWIAEVEHRARLALSEDADLIDLDVFAAEIRQRLRHP